MSNTPRRSMSKIKIEPEDGLDDERKNTTKKDSSKVTYQSKQSSKKHNQNLDVSVTKNPTPGIKIATPGTKDPTTSKGNLLSTNNKNYQMLKEIDLRKVPLEQLKHFADTKQVPKILSDIFVSNEQLNSLDYSQGVSSQIRNFEISKLQSKPPSEDKTDDGMDLEVESFVDIPFQEETFLEQEMISGADIMSDQDNLIQYSNKKDLLESNNNLEISQSHSKENASTLDDKLLYEFTSDEAARELEENDATADFTGYVDYIGKPEQTRDHRTVMHIVLNNYGSSRMMITGWNALIQPLQNIAEIGNVIQATGLMVKSKEERRYNKGNSKKYFEVQDFSTFEILGILKKLPENCGISIVDFNSLPLTCGKIRIEGFVKTAPRLALNKNFGNRIIGGISDGVKVVEFNLPEHELVNDIMKGDYVRIIGEVSSENNNTIHVIKLESAKDIIKLPIEPISDFKWFLNANKHI